MPLDQQFQAARSSVASRARPSDDTAQGTHLLRLGMCGIIGARALPAPRDRAVIPANNSCRQLLGLTVAVRVSELARSHTDHWDSMWCVSLRSLFRFHAGSFPLLLLHTSCICTYITRSHAHSPPFATMGNTAIRGGHTTTTLAGDATQELGAVT